MCLGQIDLSEWPPEYLVETQFPNGDLLVMSLYAEPLREAGWIESIIRPADDAEELPTPIWGRIMVEQGDIMMDEFRMMYGSLNPEEREYYAKRILS